MSTPPRQLLVPRDFSPTSERGLDYALDLAGRTSADIHLLHVEVVHADPFTGFVGELQVPITPGMQEQLRSRADSTEIAAPAALHVTGARDLAPAPMIVRYAEKNAVDLIVMGTHGRRGVRRFLLGSVTEEVVRLAMCSVLAVREAPSDIAGNPIVVGIDFSVSSEHALRYARMLAEIYGSPLDAVHVVPIAPYPPLYGEHAIARELPKRFAEQAASRLQSFVDGLGGDGSVTVRCHAEAGQPFRELCDHAARVGAGLIVVGAWGYSGLRHLLLGSVAERVLRLASVPVLVTKLSPDQEPGPRAGFEVA